MSETDFLEAKQLDDLFGLAAYVPPGTFYVAISSSVANEDGTNFTEPVGGGYARVALTAGGANFTRSASVVSTAVPVTISLPTSTADFVVVQGGVFDAASGGNLLGRGAASPQVTIPPGGSVTFPSGSITWSKD